MPFKKMGVGVGWTKKKNISGVGGNFQPTEISLVTSRGHPSWWPFDSIQPSNLLHPSHPVAAAPCHGSWPCNTTLRCGRSSVLHEVNLGWNQPHYGETHGRFSVWLNRSTWQTIKEQRTIHVGKYTKTPWNPIFWELGNKKTIQQLKRKRFGREKQRDLSRGWGSIQKNEDNLLKERGKNREKTSRFEEWAQLLQLLDFSLDI